MKKPLDASKASNKQDLLSLVVPVFNELSLIHI